MGVASIYKPEPNHGAVSETVRLHMEVTVCFGIPDESR